MVATSYRKEYCYSQQLKTHFRNQTDILKFKYSKIFNSNIPVSVQRRGEGHICLSNIQNQFLASLAQVREETGKTHPARAQGRHCQISPLNIQTVNMAIKSINNQWAATFLIRSHPIFTFYMSVRYK